MRTTNSVYAARRRRSRSCGARCWRLRGRAACAPAAQPTAQRPNGTATRPATTTSPRAKLPPILQKAHATRRRARSTRRAAKAIRLLEDVPGDSADVAQGTGRGAVQAGRAVLGRVEGRLSGARWASTRRAVTACHTDRTACPRVPRRPPRLDLSQAQAVYDRSSREYPRFRKIDTVIYLYAFSLRDQGQAGRVDQVLPDHPRSLSALALHRRRLDGDRRVPLLRAAELPRRRWRPTRRCWSTRSRRSTTWRCSRPPGATGSWATPPSRRCGSRTCWTWPRRRPGKTDAEQKRAEELQGQALEYLVELFTEDDTKSAQRRLRVPGPDRRQGVLAEDAEASWPTRCSTRPATSARSRPTAC